jgi:hypothetical protein
MPFLKNTPHPALHYSIFKVKNFLSQLAQFYAHAHVGGKRREGKGVVYLDFRSLCLIFAVRCAGRRLSPDSCRFTLALTKGCLAAIVAALGGGGAGGGSFYAGCHTSGDGRWRWVGGGEVCGAG